MDQDAYNILLQMQVQQKNIQDDVAEIKETVKKLPCKVNTYKIGLLQKIVFGAIAIILLAFMSTITSTAKKSNVKYKDVEQGNYYQLYDSRRVR